MATLAEAIAYAEGFFVAGSRPARNHNPGDLTVDVTGKGIGKDGPFVIYASDADGWEALNHQMELIASGASNIYNAGMSILEMAQHYTATEQEVWARNVASYLGVDASASIGDFLAGPGGSAVVVGIVALLLLVLRRR